MILLRAPSYNAVCTLYSLWSEDLFQIPWALIDLRTRLR